MHKKVSHPSEIQNTFVVFTLLIIIIKGIHNNIILSYSVLFTFFVFWISTRLGHPKRCTISRYNTINKLSLRVKDDKSEFNVGT